MNARTLTLCLLSTLTLGACDNGSDDQERYYEAVDAAVETVEMSEDQIEGLYAADVEDEAEHVACDWFSTELGRPAALQCTPGSGHVLVPGYAIYTGDDIAAFDFSFVDHCRGSLVPYEEVVACASL